MSKKEYSKDNVTVIWQSDLCIHSEKCFKGLSEVFNPKNRPWIHMEGASINQIIDQVHQCPSGALSLKGEAVATKQERQVVVTANGPLLVHGDLNVCRLDGSEEKKSKITAFCRCGGSANKPYCDGSHNRIGFEG